MADSNLKSAHRFFCSVLQSLLDPTLLKGLSMSRSFTRRVFIGSATAVSAGLIVSRPVWAAESKPVCTLENQYLRYTIGSDGRTLEFIDKATGKNHADPTQAYPCFSIMQDEKWAPVTEVTWAEGLLTARFETLGITVVIRPTIHERHIVFEVVSFSPNEVDVFNFVDLRLALEETLDEPFTACVLALNLQTNVPNLPGPMKNMRGICGKGFGCVGAKVALIGSPVDQLRGAMQEAVGLAKELPHSPIGGPWALGPKINQGSYLFNFGDMTEANVDGWVELARTLGFNQIDFHGGGSFRFGDCRPNPTTYPNGTASFKVVLDRLHTAGIKAGLHTYAFFIDKNCPWVTPVPDSRLGKDARFTLAKSLDATTDLVEVEESTDKMSAITGFFVRNSVTLQIDDELITYTGISKEAPYAFTGCTRGVLGTHVTDHEKGATVHHLKECFGYFVPGHDTTLFTEVAAKTAEMFNACGFDMIYLDALDGEDIIDGPANGWHYGSKFAFEIYKRLQRPALMEMSTFHHHLWYLRSRMGAWDHAQRSYKRFIDLHCKANETNRRMFMPSHLGWWALKNRSGPQCEPTSSDDIEYLMCKCLGLDVGLSMMGVDPSSIGSQPALLRLSEIIRRYENLRHSGKVPEAIKQKLQVPGEEFTLVGSLEEGWKFLPVQYAQQKVMGTDSPSSTWNVVNQFESQPLRLRIEALMAAGPYDAPDNITLVDFTTASEMSHQRSATGINASLDVSTDQVKAGGTSGRFTASNTTDNVVGSWTQFEKRYEPHLNLGTQQAMGVWVYGDGQGEVLNIQAQNPPHVSTADGDHYIIVDFTGWRYFELIEPEGERHASYQWPYGGIYATYRELVNHNDIEQVSLWYNNLAPGKETTCYLSPIKAIPLLETKLVNPSITIGGKTIVFPVEIKSDCYLEFNSLGDCKLFDREGKLLADVQPQGAVPTLDAGENRVQFAAGSPEGVRARANVTIISQGGVVG